MELTSVSNIKQLCNMFGFDFSKGLGQNFLLDKDVLEGICSSAAGTKGVLEIGPGFGVLTKELSKHFEKVVSVEIDNSLMKVLSYTLDGIKNVKIINEDFLKLNIKELLYSEFGDNKISVAANLPYYITTPIVTSLLEGNYNIDRIVIMVQKEVGERFCAKPGSKDYGAVTVLCDYYSAPEIITTVPKGSFFPSPKVDSCVVRMKLAEKPRVSVKNERLFFKVVKASFAQRRKTLTNCLQSGFKIEKSQIEEILTNCGIDTKIRGERLGLEEFAKISDKLSELEIS